jgi:hypothetical protein
VPEVDLTDKDLDDIIPARGRKIDGNGWQGVFRHILTK